MKRSLIDKIVSSSGLLIGLVLLAASGGMFYAHSFIHSQVHDQLAAQKISFPQASSPALASLPAPDRQAVTKYAGQPLLTGAQAETFADHYIAAHLSEIGNGQTYSELSAAAMAQPTNSQLAKQVDTVFKGETLRGLLLNAYAFDSMASVAYVAAMVSMAAGVLLLILSALGFRHAKLAKRR
ncbi:MAG: hypothetical protein ABI221_03030 [Candidatus Saccharimonadales bacterium]